LSLVGGRKGNPATHLVVLVPATAAEARGPAVPHDVVVFDAGGMAVAGVGAPGGRRSVATGEKAKRRAKRRSERASRRDEGGGKRRASTAAIRSRKKSEIRNQKSEIRRQIPRGGMLSGPAHGKECAAQMSSAQAMDGSRAMLVVDGRREIEFGWSTSSRLGVALPRLANLSNVICFWRCSGPVQALLVSFSEVIPASNRRCPIAAGLGSTPPSMARAQRTSHMPGTRRTLTP